VNKICGMCKIEKDINDFYNNKSNKDGKDRICKICSRRNTDNYQKNNKEKYLASQGIRQKKYKKSSPWKFTFTDIKQRCNNPKNIRYADYGGRGIKCLITLEEIKKLWFRDKAYKLKKPSIDRINNDESYTFENCRYIEMPENSGKDKRKCINQLDLNGKLIATFNSTLEAEKITGFSHKAIGRVALGKRRKAYGFIWKYKGVKDGER